MIYVGIEVLISAAEKIANPIDQDPSILTIIVAVFSAAVMFAVYKYNLNLSKELTVLLLKRQPTITV